MRALGVGLNGLAMEEVDARGEPITDDMLLVNGHDEQQRFKLPGPPGSPRCVVLLDTNMATVVEGRSASPGEVFELHPRTLVLLRQPKEQL